MGLGRVFERFHLAALRSGSGWTLAGGVDASPERLRWAATACGRIPMADSLSSLLEELRPDAVLISTTPESHCAVAAEALRGGAHVLIEKPMVLLSAEADRLVDMARSLGRQIRVGFNRRFRPAYTELRNRIAEQPAGSVHEASFVLCSDPLGWHSVSSHLGNQVRGGGLLEDIGSHQLDLVPWVVGRAVVGVRARFLHVGGVHSSASLELRFEDGLVASCLAGHQPRYSERLQVDLNGRRWLAGPGGLVRMGVVPSAVSRRYLVARSAARAVRSKVMRLPGDTLETFRRQFLTWAEEIRAPGAGPRSRASADGVDGARNVALVEACRRSLTSDGAWVDTQTTHMATTP